MAKFISAMGAAAVLTSLLVASVCTAAPPVHSARGGGTIDYADARNTHAFTAQIDADGHVKGEAEFQLRYLNLTLHVEVDCLAVVGNDAWIGGEITISSNPALVGQRVLFRVQDNGEGAGPPDATSQVVIGGGPSVDGIGVPPCTLTPPLALIPWTNGNVQVR